jgi:hydrogenase-1 operon protein HyaF
MHPDDTVASATRGAVVPSVLREVAELLTAFAAGGPAGVIDLRSLPLTAGERDELEAGLGRGDVVINLDVAGQSEIWETGYAGVWWVRHFGADDRIAAERIEIAAIPEIVTSHRADAAVALARLREQLDGPSDRQSTTTAIFAAEQDSDHA